MVFIACGLNHKTAPLSVRETFALSSEKQKNVMHALMDLPEINEILLLSTCNRTEWYCDAQDAQLVLSWFAESHQMSLEQLHSHLYLFEGQAAVQHALRVASGLDSMMLGEPQILGQMKQAFLFFEAQNTIGSQLQQVFPFIFGATKRIRNQSGIGQHATSIAYAASKLIQQHCQKTTNITTLLIGSGETATLVAKYLHQQGTHQFMIASRSEDHALTLADQYAGEVIPVQDLIPALTKADVIVSATACPYPFISPSMVTTALEQRHHAPMLFLDLAVPRDIEPQVSDLPYATLYNIDDLERLTQEGLQQRQAAAQHAEQLIDFELNTFMNEHRALRAKTLICDYRNTMQALAEQELQRALQKLNHDQSPNDVMTEFSQRLIKKFTHIPSIGLRQAALDQRDDVLDLAHAIFHSDEHSYEDIT
ncbi:MAG: glutamyl-tRNA reductase [Gammaproteobacteria bacterium]|nr:glutamyl-tRNA reductase [Gammaproteobacteria bacterium]